MSKDPSFSKMVTEMYDEIQDANDDLRAVNLRLARLEGAIDASTRRICEPTITADPATHKATLQQVHAFGPGRILEFEPPWEERLISEVRSLRKEVVALRKDIGGGGASQGRRNR